MATTFSVDSNARFEDVTDAWTAVRILAECVAHVVPSGSQFPPEFELSGDNKHWTRETLPDLAVVRETYELDSFVVYWGWAADGMQWGLDAHTYEDGDTDVQLSVYAGVDLIKTEEAMRTVLARASERGVKLKMGPVEYRADESKAKARDTVVLNKGPMKKWKIFRAWVGPHLPSYIVGTLSSITSAVLLIVLGFGG